MNPRSSTAQSPAFPNTRWSIVLAATQTETTDAAAALEALCRAYWYPLYAYARRSGQSPHDAQDLAQEFFARLLAHRWLADADREKGKLRTFLITAFKNFMAKEWRRATAEKRGSAQTPLPLDTDIAEIRYRADAMPTHAADAAYDRQWALTLLNVTIDRLRTESVERGHPDHFEALKECLMAERGSLDYRSIAARLGGGEGAARVAVHRLRKRFRDVFREEVARTVSEDADLEAEMRHLAACL
ncbi:MAG: RNA polymerase sigma factor [Verrucomicrobiales bacterium]